MLGDLNIAEPGALIGFAGPRVIEQTIRQKLPEGFQRSEFLLEHGMLDLIVDRREMKSAIARALRFMGQHPVEAADSRRKLAVAEPLGTGTENSWTRSVRSTCSRSRSSASSSASRTSGRSRAALGEPQRSSRPFSSPARTAKGRSPRWSTARCAPSGLKVGRYTSPHLVRLEERFAIDGAPVDTAVLAGLIEEMRRLIDELLAKGSLESPPTFFEVTTAIAFELFRRARVDVAVLEVGLGGRLDSTNIAQPIAAAITSIDFDHEQYLGNTLAAIAAEKAGVIRRDIPVVVGPVAPEARDVIVSMCEMAGAEFIEADAGVRIRVDERGRTHVDAHQRRRCATTDGCRSDFAAIIRCRMRWSPCGCWRSWSGSCR